MKKLLFAIAGAAAFSAFAADPALGNHISLVGFENYTVDQTVIGYGDNGQEGGSLWSCAGDDASLVKAYAGGDVSAPDITEPDPFNGAAENNNYLNLDTNGAELQRAIPAAGQQIAADGTYIDTLIQFTPSESAPTDLADAKIAIWLGVDSDNTTTNLCVAGGFYEGAELDNGIPTGAPSVSPKTYKLSGTYDPSTWYRLTVKAIKFVEAGESVYVGFQISIDGTPLTTDTAAYDSNAMVAFGLLNAETSLLTGNLLVPSAYAALDDNTLTSVGFKGTGALDDFIVTTEQPTYPAAAIDFTLTWPSGVTPVSYTIDGGEPVSISSETSPFSVPGLAGGETVYFTFTNADGVTKTMSATAADDGDVDAADAVYVWADYLGAAVSGAYQIDDANDLDMLRKGVAAGLATVGETFNQTANIDMTSADPFAGIGTYAANLNSGLAFQGTYDGQGFKIANITMTARNYGGVFNQVKGGTIKDLTVENITAPANATGEFGYAIVGNAGLGATLQGLTAMGSFGTAELPCSHNVAGIAIRVCGGASNVVNGVTMLETLVKDCTNNATLYGFYTKCGGITALTQDQNGVPNDYVLFDGCVNNANIAMVQPSGSDLSKIGRDGLGGILAYVADGTKMQNCVNNGTLTSPLTTAKIGGIVGWAQGRTLDDLGGNKNPAAAKMIGDPSGSAITGFEYATVDNGVATTITGAPVAGGTYLLERNVAASETPVATLTAVGDTISFDTALGYTFAGTVASSGAAGYPVASTSGTVTTYSAGYFPRTATAGQDGSAANPFEIADVDDLQALAAYTAGHGLSYIQTADIDMATAGTFPGIGGDFTGTYDGGDKTISNLKFAANTYRGLFNKTTGATIKNLTIDTVSFETPGSGVEFGGAAFVGKVYANTVLSNLTAKGSVAAGTPGNHNVAGIAARVYATGVKFIECSNEASLYAETRKLGGILTIIQGTASVDFIGCSNSGTLVTTTKTHHDIGDDKDYDTGADGLAGIIGYANAATTLKDCVNTGTIQTHAENTKASIGGLIGKCGSVAITDLGGNKCAADMKMIGTQAGTITGFQYATVDDSTPAMATTTDTLATNTTFLLERNVAASATPVFTLAAEGEWIEFDKALGYTFAGTVAGANTTNETGTVVRYSWAAPQPAYPNYIDPTDSAIATAYNTWMTTNGADADSSKEAQFVLNVAPSTTVASNALAITAIEQNETAGWDITVECTVPGVDLEGTVNSARVNNGYLAVSYTDDLGGTWTTENINITASANGAVTVNVNKSGAKFMKVKLSAMAEPQN